MVLSPLKINLKRLIHVLLNENQFTNINCRKLRRSGALPLSFDIYWMFAISLVHYLPFPLIEVTANITRDLLQVAYRRENDATSAKTP
jgi:hypothetical protein